MDAPENPLSELFGIIKSWIPWRSDPSNVSRDFWMPDHSCRVCYECDIQFTFLNRRHHCRRCGRVFCGRCTSNSIPVLCADPRTSCEEWERIRVCNYCFRQWEQQNISRNENGEQSISQELGSLSTGESFGSPKSEIHTPTGRVSPNSMSDHFGSCKEEVQPSPYLTSAQPFVMSKTINGPGTLSSGEVNDFAVDRVVQPQNSYAFSMTRSDDDDDEEYQSDADSRHYPRMDSYESRTELDESPNPMGPHDGHHGIGNIDSKSLTSSSFQHSFISEVSDGVSQLDKKHDDRLLGDEGEVASSYPAEVETDSLDFEDNGIIWRPPDPENEDDDKEDFLYDDDDDEGDASGEWGRLRSSGSFGRCEFRNRDRSGEDQKNVMKNVVYGHFQALVAQLLQVENLPISGEDSQDNWLDIITSLSWEAASLLKPDMSRSGGMDPGGYVKVKCLATGRRCESSVIKGVVCKKNVAHRRMTSKIEKPRILILGGALEYQRVSNLLSSFDTLLQQEMDHLKMAVAKIDAHQPDVLLVENSVSRFAQEYLLEKDISLVLNIKRPLLERVARCTGAQIVPSVDHLSSQKLGYCEKFHVVRFQEDHGTAGQGGKKMMKTLMFFEGCPKPLGFTILLKGAYGDELKKIKAVVQYGVFAAYHLASETSFLADERASLPELPLRSPITVALPEKSLSIDRSISMIPGFKLPSSEKPHSLEISKPQRLYSVSIPMMSDLISSASLQNTQMSELIENSSSMNPIVSLSCVTSEKAASDFDNSFLLLNDKMVGRDLVSQVNAASVHDGSSGAGDHLTINGFLSSERMSHNDFNDMVPSKISEGSSAQVDEKKTGDEQGMLQDEFPPSPSEHRSILVSLSSRCVWKGTVCERSHLFRIKYYGNFDKPLGRFLRDHLFDQSYRCHSCEMPTEAHVHCYTHRQGTLTISVKRLSDFVLPGEREGKIWMWHRCLQCPRSNGFPPATKRVIMSDAAWGLSFGKFLELSFSNHAAASRVASCGHSLHRDCLRFYGFGDMIACFRYASICVHSVFLPPHKLDFIWDHQKWIQKEADEVINRAELLFSEVLNALRQIKEGKHATGHHVGGNGSHDLRRNIMHLEDMLQREKMEFNEVLQKILQKEVIKGQPLVDILEINKLRRQLLFQSFMWDHRLINVCHNTMQDSSPGDLITGKENPSNINEISTETTALAKPEVLSRVASEPVDTMLIRSPNFTAELEFQMKKVDMINQDNERYENENQEEESQTNHLDPLLSGKNVRRALSEGQILTVAMVNLSDTLDAAWTGEAHPSFSEENDKTAGEHHSNPISINAISSMNGFTTSGNPNADINDDSNRIPKSMNHWVPSDNVDDAVSWLGHPFLSLYGSLSKNFSQKLDLLTGYNPVYVAPFRDSDLQNGGHFFLPVGLNDTVIPVHDDEPTSLIAYALASSEYNSQLLEEAEKVRDLESFSLSFSDTINLQSMPSFDDSAPECPRSVSSADDNILSLPGSLGSLVMDPLSYTKALHAKVNFSDDDPHGKAKYSVICYYAKRFEALRRICCPSELDYIRSLSRCKKWGAQGGKSNVFFAKTLDDRFIIKQVTKTELESFIKFAPEYFKYLSESISSGSPTCLAKILGIYQVASKHLKGGRELKMDVLVMENLLFHRNVTRLYDLKGSSRSRYNPDSSGTNKVLLDQNLIEAMLTSPIFVGSKAKRLLERAVWNDTSFLASVDVMDYSLLVGVDEDKNELVLGIIDFMRQYTWDKHLETWVKASGLLGGPKNASPTVISPKQYKKRFRKAMTTYFLMVPDQWSPPTIIPSNSKSDLLEESAQSSLPMEG
ncbi:hypothetical protein SAY86_025822 [Trapa natans]|uniref:1-phosphatidylinositol-3-phosphate 5-kinase n=1 Tax=Trapa natans TaxID=22666 RepID=A0AAN7QDY0_TRANT|nr:hypothetical protein SAY86_025822 [Trapa natans]